VEIIAIVLAIVIVALFVGVTPYLASSGGTGQIGIFKQQEYANETATIQRGQTAVTRFKYDTYDPAILKIDIQFQDWKKPGNLSIYLNYVLIDSFEATPKNPNFNKTTITFSGFELVKPPPVDLGMSSSAQFFAINLLYFESPLEGGYEGTFNYQVSIRGSR
jgi:hypothetical protein